VVYAIIPAAGIGSRMQSSIPKQYLPLGDGTVLLQSLRALLAVPAVDTIMVALHPQDQWWPGTWGQLTPSEQKRVNTCTGGDERWQSVLAALSVLATIAQPDAPVMVHDAVRPCVQVTELQQLMQTYNTQSLQEGTPGALLAMPVTDTLKRADDTQRVQATVDRQQMWAACTPQIFPLAALQHALIHAGQSGAVITDESSAMELAGVQPALVRCSRDNIKITYPGDLELASWILSRCQSARDQDRSNTL
jgi:2-C-methyl-D-erythritol 4-phosphate cytidylyltransferase